MWSYLVFGVSYAFAAAVQPGPFQTFLVAETLSRGWRRTLPAAFAPLLSDVPIAVVALLVLSRIPADLVRFFHLAGGLFLLYLAHGAYRTWRRQDAVAETDIRGSRGTLLKAALVNLLNPNPWLGWSLVMGPLFLKGYREDPAHGVALIGGFYTTMVVCLAGLITLFAGARRLGPTVGRVTVGLSAIALAGFACYQLWLGFA